MPPYSSGIVTPNRPSSFICSTIGSGNLSSWSYSSAFGRISLSTKLRTISTMAFCSSVISSKLDCCCSVATAMAGRIGKPRRALLLLPLLLDALALLQLLSLLALLLGGDRRIRIRLLRGGLESDVVGSRPRCATTTAAGG